jgi:hypothetical protein
MRSTRAVLHSLVLLILSATAACTGEPSDATPRGSGSPAPTLDVGSQGFIYVAPGLEATFELEGDEGRLVVLNETGFPLGRPDLYLLDARDGARVSAAVATPSRIPDGATRRFDVTVDDAPERKHVGLVVLLFGADNYGAFEAAEDVR